MKLYKRDIFNRALQHDEGELEGPLPDHPIHSARSCPKIFKKLLQVNRIQQTNFAKAVSSLSNIQVRPGLKQDHPAREEDISQFELDKSNRYLNHILEERT